MRTVVLWFVSFHRSLMANTGSLIYLGSLYLFLGKFDDASVCLEIDFNHIKS